MQIYINIYYIHISLEADITIQAMECPACKQLLSKKYWSDSQWKHQFADGPEPDWLWACKRCTVEAPVETEYLRYHWRRFQVQVSKLDAYHISDLLRDYSTQHSASIFYLNGEGKTEKNVCCWLPYLVISSFQHKAIPTTTTFISVVLVRLRPLFVWDTRSQHC